MSVSAIGNYANPLIYSSQQTTPAPTTTSTGSTPRAATSMSGSGSGSDRVTLSSDAQAIANLNAAGITVESLPLADVPNLASLDGSATQSASDSASSTPASGGNAGLSESEFATVLAGYGATSAQADQYFTDIDTNSNGEISNSELISALGDTGSDTGSALSQGLLSLMDTGHTGVVTGSEFISFETSLVTAEKTTS